MYGTCGVQNTFNKVKNHSLIYCTSRAPKIDHRFRLFRAYPSLKKSARRSCPKYRATTAAAHIVGTRPRNATFVIGRPTGEHLLAWWRPPWYPSVVPYCRDGPMVSGESRIGPPWCREAQASRTTGSQIDVKFLERVCACLDFRRFCAVKNFPMKKKIWDIVDVT